MIASLKKTHIALALALLILLTGLVFSQSMAVRITLAVAIVAVAVLALTRDLRKREQTEGTSRETSSLQRAILDSANYIIISTDPDGTIRTFNRAAERWLGYDQDEVVGKATPAIFHDPDDASRRAQELAQEMGIPFDLGYQTFLEKARRGIADESEWTYVRKDGSRFPVRLSLTALRDERGEITGFLGIGSDITERKRVEEELAQARDAALESARVKSEFLANMSHEIRTPINGIIGVTGILTDMELLPEQRDLARLIQSSADSLLILINDILDLSKMEAGKLQLEHLDFDMRLGVESVAELLAERAQDKGIELATLIDNDAPTLLRGDPTRLRQILTNLISNAIKFTNQGEVVVSVTRQAEDDDRVTLRFEVRDTGVGIPEDIQRRLFQPFSQADGSTTRQYGGTGLGLSICKQLVELMGGKIGVSSIPDYGSTFWFAIPFDKQSPESALPALSGASLDKARVLVVISNATSCSLIYCQVASWGLPCDKTTSSDEALFLLHQQAYAGTPYHIVIFDHNLSGTDGVTFARSIKFSPTLGVTRLVMLTYLRRHSDYAALREVGVDAFLTKPVNQSSLYNCLAKMLAGAATMPGVGCQVPGAGDEPLTSDTRHLTPDTRRYRVLVVEDNVVNQQVALYQLRKIGYETDVAANGQEAVAALDRVLYDAVLMDCQMPVMDGYAATAEIRRREGGDRRTPIIALTAHAMSGDRQKCLDAGMDDYISKPVKPEDLAAVLRRWLAAAPEAVPADTPPNAAPGNTAKMDEAVDQGVLASLRGLSDDGRPTVLCNLIGLFLADAPARLAEMGAAARQGDAQELAKAAHALKSSCGNLGATRLHLLCRMLEERSKAGKVRGAERVVAEIENEFERVRLALEAEKEKAESEL